MKTLGGASIVLGLIANAYSPALEDANSLNTSLASYQDVYIEAQIIMPLATETPLPKKKIPSWVYCSCIETAKYLHNQEGISWGNAGDLIPNTTEPEVGDLVLTWEGPGHGATIIEKDEFGFWVDEGNYIPCQRTRRYFEWESKLIRGYWKVPLQPSEI